MTNPRRWSYTKVSELLRLLSKAGCRFLEHRGEHDFWYSPITNKEFQIPRHKAKELPTGTTNKIKKDAGIK